MHHNAHSKKTGRTFKYGICIVAAIFALAAIYIAYMLNKFAGTGAMAGVLIAAAAVCFLMIFFRKKYPYIIGIAGICMLIISLPAVYVLHDIDKPLQRMANTNEYEVVQIAARSGSGITADDDFDNYKLGYDQSDDQALKYADEIIYENGKKLEENKPYTGAKQLWTAFKKGSVDMIVLDSTTKSDLSNINENYESKIKTIFKKEYPMASAKAKQVDISKEPFTVYLQGTDLSSGYNITSTGRGDVNILLTINPVTKEVYMQAVPRDTFVRIPCRNGSSKLSYSGWWGGVQSSIESIEEEFNIEINYYAKINFNGIAKLVDDLGGVTVYSHYTYTAAPRVYFTKGWNEVDGDEALIFVRARKMLPENELSRGQHQMELIKAIFVKFGEDPTYNNAMSLLDGISHNFATNVPEDDYYKMYKVVKSVLPQLQTMENNSIKGEFKWHDDEIRTGYYQYYYYPEKSEIQRVHDKIAQIKKNR